MTTAYRESRCVRWKQHTGDKRAYQYCWGRKLKEAGQCDDSAAGDDSYCMPSNAWFQCERTCLKMTYETESASTQAG
jgi:hypothetical protein